MPDTAPQQPARQELEKSAAIENPDPLLASIQAATAYKYRGQAGLSPAPSMSHDPSHQLTPVRMEPVMSQLPHQPQVSDRDSADRRPKPQYQGLFLEPNVPGEPFEDDQDLMEDQLRSITA